MSNEPDNIRDFDHNPQSPYFQSDEDYVASEVDKLFNNVDAFLEKIFNHPDFNNKFSAEYELLNGIWENKEGEIEDTFIKFAEKMIRARGE